MKLVLRAAVVGTMMISARTQVYAQSSVPVWARERWEILAKTRSLQLSSHVKVNTLTGDFDGDSTPDVAILVADRYNCCSDPRTRGRRTDIIDASRSQLRSVARRRQFSKLIGVLRD